MTPHPPSLQLATCLVATLFGCSSPKISQVEMIAPLDVTNPALAPTLRAFEGAIRALAKPAVTLEVRVGEALPDEPTSCIGGRPCLPPGLEWPIERNGTPMQFLAQILYDEMPPIPGYPTSGLLSVFVGDGFDMGLFAEPSESGRVLLWHESTAGFVRRDPPRAPSQWDVFGSALRLEGAPLVGSITEGLPTSSCYEVHALLEALGGTLSRDDRDELSETVEPWLGELHDAPLYYGGYPAFTQMDIRGPDDDPPWSDVVLQMGYLNTEEPDWRICLGDAGEATFLLQAADLLGRRFDRVYYCWDCH